MTENQAFGTEGYPGFYRGVYGYLMVNAYTGEIVDDLKRDMIANAASLNALPADQDVYKRNIYSHVQDEVFRVDEDSCLPRALGDTETGVEIDINFWAGTDADATVTIDDTGTHVRVHPIRERGGA